MVENMQSECDDDPLMGNNQYDRYYLDDDWYQDIKLDASIPISSGEDLISSTSFHTNNKDKSSTPFNNLSSNSPKNQNNGNIISNQKCLFDKNKDSADANLELFIGDDNDNPASYLTNKSYETEVRIFAFNESVSFNNNLDFRIKPRMEQMSGRKWEDFRPLCL